MAAAAASTWQRQLCIVAAQKLTGQEPLNGFGAVGEVRADSYEVLDDGNRIILKGNVWTKFTPKKKRGQ